MLHLLLYFGQHKDFFHRCSQISILLEKHVKKFVEDFVIVKAKLGEWLVDNLIDNDL